MVVVPDRISRGGVVTISATQPPIQLDGNLWFNSATGALAVSQNGAWTPMAGGGGAGLPEVEVGATAPVSAAVTVWIDTSTTPVTPRYRSGNSWVTSLDFGRY